MKSDAHSTHYYHTYYNANSNLNHLYLSKLDDSNFYYTIANSDSAVFYAYFCHN